MAKNPMILLILVLLASCNKNWLDEKRDISLTVPTTLKDMRALLNYQQFPYDFAGMAETSCDDYYLTDASFQLFPERERNTYTWKPSIYPDQSAVGEWNSSYVQVFYANNVLEGLDKMTPRNHEHTLWNTLYGEALFHRARAFYNLMQVFAPSFDATTAGSDLGIPLRLTADLNAPSTRQSSLQCYEKIISDLTDATQRLPITAGDRAFPSKAAAYAMLARCYLAMRDYEHAKRYADTAIHLHPALLDFQEMDSSPSYPISPYNPEVIYQSTLFPSAGNFSANFGLPDTLLYESYSETDLRRTFFFRTNADGTISFRGNYTGANRLFSGTTTAEMLLIRAECHARDGAVDAAFEDLNHLLKHRHDSRFIPLEVSGDALITVLRERRKELLRRGLRWSDLRRLNHEPTYRITLQRKVGDLVFELSPQDPRYVLPIPDYVVSANNIPQNSRW